MREKIVAERGLRVEIFSVSISSVYCSTTVDFRLLTLSLPGRVSTRDGCWCMHAAHEIDDGPTRCILAATQN